MLRELGRLFHPLYQALAYLIAFWYDLVPNYAVAIALFTLTVMLVLAPLTVKSTRSMLAMQRLQPEMNAIKAKYKNDKMAQQTEMSQLMKANGVNPAGGCLPMLIQLPVFIVLYKVIQGLTKTALVNGVRVVQPEYISHTSYLYKNLIAAHGAMNSFGINLAKSATSSHGSLLGALPFYGLLVVCIGLQFLQMRQLNSRAPKQTGTAAQTQAVMKFMPLIFGFIYLAIPAGVNVYFLVSSLFRIGQQELMYRFDPQVRGHAEAVRERGRAPEQRVPTRGAPTPTAQEGAPGGFRGSLRALRAELATKSSASEGAEVGRPAPRSGREVGPGPAPRAGRSVAPTAGAGGQDRQAKPKESAPIPRAPVRTARKTSPGAAENGRTALTPSGSGRAGMAPVATTRSPAARADLPGGSGRGSRAERTGARRKATRQDEPESWSRRPQNAATVAVGGPDPVPPSGVEGSPSPHDQPRPRNEGSRSSNRSKDKRTRRPR